MKNGILNIKERVREIKGYKDPPSEAEIKLNQNENPFPIPDEIKDDIFNTVREMEWGRYPKFDPDELRCKLGEYVKFVPEGILVSNGSDEMIFALFHAVISKDDKILITPPTFAVYELVGNIVEGEIIKVNHKDDLSFNVEGIIQARETYNPRLTIIPTPCNPTGSVLNIGEIEEILRCGDGILALDEAYIQFSDNPEGALDLVDKFSNLVILRTFSKAFSAAGLRIGYMITNPELAVQFRKVLIPYNLGIFTSTVGIKILEAKDLIKERVRYIIEQREYLFNELKKIKGIKPYPSQANFILFECLEKDVKMVFNKLYETGILVRDMSSYRMLSKALRVTAGKREENDIFLGKLKEIAES
ncbi:histidinol-phosphate transaminase [candidate division KSB1 bacterium]